MQKNFVVWKPKKSLFIGVGVDSNGV